MLFTKTSRVIRARVHYIIDYNSYFKWTDGLNLINCLKQDNEYYLLIRNNGFYYIRLNINVFFHNPKTRYYVVMEINASLRQKVDTTEKPEYIVF